MLLKNDSSILRIIIIVFFLHKNMIHLEINLYTWWKKLYLFFKWNAYYANIINLKNNLNHWIEMSF